MANPLLFSPNEISRRKKPFISDHRPTFNDDDDDETLTIEGRGGFSSSRFNAKSFAHEFRIEGIIDTSNDINTVQVYRAGN